MAAEAALSASEYAAIATCCQALVWRAAAIVDSQRAEQLAEVFAEDAVMVRPGGRPLNGVAEIIHAYTVRPAERITRHLVTNTLVEAQSRFAAHSRSYVLLWTGSGADDASPQGRPALTQVIGEFDDAFEHRPAGWRIVRREARFVLHAGCESTQS